MGHKKLKKKLELCIIEKRQLNDMIRDYRYQMLKLRATIDDLTARVARDDDDIAEYRAKLAELSNQNKELQAKIARQALNMIMGHG